LAKSKEAKGIAVSATEKNAPQSPAKGRHSHRGNNILEGSDEKMLGGTFKSESENRNV